MKNKIKQKSNLYQRSLSLAKRQDGATIMETVISIVGFSLIMLFVLASFVLMGRTYFKSVSENKTQEVTRNVIDSISESIRTAGVDYKPLDCVLTDGSDLSTVISTITPAQKATPCETVDHYIHDHWKGYCVGNVGYIYRVGRQLKNPDSERAFVVIRHCDVNVDAYTNLQNNISSSTKDSVIELLRKDMRVVHFTIDNNVRTTNNDPDLYQLHLKVAFGGDQDDWETDSEVFVWKTGGTPPAVLVPGTDKDAEILLCQRGETWCAVSELKTKAYKQIK